MNRRALVAAVGAAAAAAGFGVAWLRRPQPLPPDDGTLWQASFAQPDGGTLAMASLRGQPLVLNFWATWCAPCVKEMPELDRIARDFAPRGVRVVGLAIDNPTNVREFLRKTPVGYPIGLAGFDGTDLARKLGNAQGGLPFTALFDARGAAVRVKLGQTSHDELAQWLKAL